MNVICFFFFFSSRRRHTRLTCDWSSDVCSSDLQAHDGTVLLDVHDRGTADPLDGGGGAQASAGAHVPGLLQRKGGVPGLRVGRVVELSAAEPVGVGVVEV